MEEPDTDKTIPKTIPYRFLKSHFEQLFSLILTDKVSISSIHASTKAKNLLDLKQCLHITATFEYYQRTFLPNISSQSTLEVYEDAKKFLGYMQMSKEGRKRERQRVCLYRFHP